MPHPIDYVSAGAIFGFLAGIVFAFYIDDLRERRRARARRQLRRQRARTILDLYGLEDLPEGTFLEWSDSLPRTGRGYPYDQDLED